MSDRAESIGHRAGQTDARSTPVFRPCGPAVYAELVKQFGADWKVNTCVGADAEQALLLLSAITQVVSVTVGIPVGKLQLMILDHLSREGTLTMKLDRLPY